MINILKGTFESTNFKPNSTTYQITLTIDSDLTNVNDINSVLCNNGLNYKSMDGIAHITTNSTALIYSPNYLYMYKFVAEQGSLNSSTGYNEGIWRCIGKKQFITI
jgi:hypothetical protein